MGLEQIAQTGRGILPGQFKPVFKPSTTMRSKPPCCSGVSVMRKAMPAWIAVLKSVSHFIPVSDSGPELVGEGPTCKLSWIAGPTKSTCPAALP